jgi:hypothetical protein
MLRNILLLSLIVFVVGCSKYDITQPKTLFQDPHFSQYKEERDILESQYLNKEIDYSAYVEQRDALDARYDKEVNQRDQKISY